MFIEQGNTPQNEFWKYIIGFLLVFLGMIVGQIPLTIAIFYKAFSTNVMPTQNNDIYKMFDSNLLLFLMLISFVFAFYILYLVVQKYHQQDFKSIITSRKKIDWKRFMVAFSIWAIFTVLVIVIGYFIDSSEVQVQFNLIPFLILTLLSLTLIPIQTSTEELLFRGYLMQGFYNLARNKWVPLAATSILFGLMHIMNPEVEKMGYIILVYYIGTGLFLGIMTLMDEGTELALGFHAANNIVSALLITSDFTVFQTHSIFKDLSEPSVGFDIFFPFVLYFLLLFLFAKIYNWNNWYEKLIGSSPKTSIFKH